MIRMSSGVQTIMAADRATTTGSQIVQDKVQRRQSASVEVVAVPGDANNKKYVTETLSSHRNVQAVTSEGIVGTLSVNAGNEAYTPVVYSRGASILSDVKTGMVPSWKTITADMIPINPAQIGQRFGWGESTGVNVILGDKKLAETN